MPKFLDNIEFYTEGYSEKTLTINKETVDVDLEKKSWNEEWSKWNDEGKVELEIPSEKIKYPSEDPAKKKITDVSRDIEEKKDEAIYKIGALSGAGLNATNELVQMGLNIIGEKTDEASSLINNGKEEIKSSTNQGLNVLEERIEAGLGQINDLNLHNGQGSGSLQQVSVKYTGPDIYDGENVGLRTGDIILGADATGVQSFAIGGLRYDCASYNYIKINEKYYDVISLSPVTLQYKKEGEDGYIAPIQEENGTISVEGTSWEVSVNDKTVTLTDTQNNISITSSPYGGREATSAEGNQSFAAGGSVHAYGDWSAAIGKDTKAYQGASISVGGGNIAGMPKETFDEIQDGQNPEITETNDEEDRGWKDTYSFAFAAGSGNKAYGRNAFAVNGQNTVWMTDGAAFGNDNNVYARNGLVGGQSNILRYDAKNAFVIGGYNEVAGANSLVVGGGSYYDASGTKITTPNVLSKDATASIVGGIKNSVSAAKSIVGGEGNTAKSTRVLVSGQSNTVTGENSAAFGKNNAVTSWNCMSIGENNNITSTGSSFTAGNNNTITGYHNIAAGTNNNVSGQSNITVGARNTVSAGASLVGGIDNQVLGSRSLVVGGGSAENKNTTTGGATGVVVGGIKNIVSAVNAIVGGEGNTASSWNSLVIGVGNTVKTSGQSIVGGYQNTNTGNNSFVAGQNNNNSGQSSLLVGSNLINTTSNKTVVGKNNSDNASALFIVGNGNSSTDADRKNAFEALVDGRAKVYGEPTESDDVLRLNEFSVLTQIQVNLLF